jgi:hypothetical protein
MLKVGSFSCRRDQIKAFSFCTFLGANKGILHLGFLAENHEEANLKGEGLALRYTRWKYHVETDC